MTPLTGFTQSAITPSTNGDYAVIINEVICLDTSQRYNITGLNINKTIDIEMEIYPNPTSYQLKISTSENIDLIEILDQTGMSMGASKSSLIDVSYLSPGI
jgi:hypothetical protein